MHAEKTNAAAKRQFCKKNFVLLITIFTLYHFPLTIQVGDNGGWGGNTHTHTPLHHCHHTHTTSNTNTRHTRHTEIPRHGGHKYTQIQGQGHQSMSHTTWGKTYKAINNTWKGKGEWDRHKATHNAESGQLSIRHSWGHSWPAVPSPPQVVCVCVCGAGVAGVCVRGRG